MGKMIKIEHLDDNETLFFLRDLEHKDPKKYEQLFAALMARKFVPLMNGIPDTALSHRYKMYEVTGESKAISPDTTSLPTVGVKAREVTRNIKSIGVQYEWTVDEIKESARTGAQLDEFTVMSAQSAVERQIDTLLALGDTSLGIEGLLNHTGVPTTSPTTGTWTGATADQIIADEVKQLGELRAALAQSSFSGGQDLPAFDRFAQVLSPAAYTKITTTPRSTTSDTTIFAWLMQNIPYLESLEEWNHCTSGGVSFMYPRSELCVGGIVNQEFFQHAPQAVGLKIVVPCQAKCGGTIIRYPVACRKMSGV